MSVSDEKLAEVNQFITDYIRWSQERGAMYGSIYELESNWNLLNHIYFIIKDIQESFNECNFASFLRKKGFGAKRAATVIEEQQGGRPYEELNRLWNEYIMWRDNNIKLGK